MYIFAVYHTEWCSLGQIKCVWNGQEEHWTLLGFTDPRVMLQKPRKLGNLHQLHKVSYSPSKSVMGVSVNFITSSLAYRMALVLHTTAFPAPLKFHCSSCSPPPFFVWSCMKKHLLISCTLPSAKSVGMFMVICYSSDLENEFSVNATKYLLRVMWSTICQRKEENFTDKCRKHNSNGCFLHDTHVRLIFLCWFLSLFHWESAPTTKLGNCSAPIFAILVSSSTTFCWSSEVQKEVIAAHVVSAMQITPCSYL